MKHFEKFFSFVSIGLIILAITADSSAGTLSGIKLAIDPGHGGQSGQTYNGLPGDPGAIGPTGLREADCALTIGARVRDLLTAQGATVYMTRASDVFVSLSGRTNLANSLAVDRFVSIHQNASSSQSANYTGSHVYTSASQNSKDLASKTVNELDLYHKIGVVSTNIGIRGVHADNFHVVRETNMPAQLVENSFISNPTEEQKLKNISHLNSSADAIFKGIMTHLGKTVPSDAVPPVISHSAVSQAQEGSALQISATITDASGISSAKLYYRARGTSVWTSVTMVKGAGEIYSATIPSSIVTPSGVEYYIEASDAFSPSNLGRLPSGSPVSPFIVNVTASPKTGTLQGIVSDQTTGAKISGAEAVISPGGQKVYSSATGLYVFSNLTPGQYTVSVTKSGYSSNSGVRNVEAGSTWWNSIAISKLPAGPQAGDIVVNEIMWDGYEYIELYNRTSNDISIANWRITAGTGATTDRVQVIINSPAIIKAKGYYVAADARALTGITVDEIDAQTWKQSGQIVTLWTGSPTNSSSQIIDRIGSTSAWFGGKNTTKGISMERKKPELAGTEPNSWQTSNGKVGSREGTAGAGNSSGLITQALVRKAASFMLAASSILPSQTPIIAAPISPQTISASLMPMLVAASSYEGSERFVTIEGPTLVSPGSVHTFTANAFEGDKLLTSVRFDVEFGNEPSVTVTKAVTVNTSKGKETLEGSLVVSVERQTGVISASLNQSNGQSRYESELSTMIRNASSSVKVAIYALDSRMDIDALIYAAENLGPENVQIVMDGSNYSSSLYSPYAKELEAAGITIVKSDQSGNALMHDKFAIIDERTVWVGSANMTVKDSYNNANNALVIRSNELASAYLSEFNRMWSGKFSTAKGGGISAQTTIRLPSDIVDINKARASTFAKLSGVSEELAANIISERKKNGPFTVIEDLLQVPGMDAAIFNAIRNRIAVDPVKSTIEAEVYFSPSGEIKNRIIEAIDGAQTEIAFAIFTFTDPDIASALERAKDRGVKVRGVADAWQALSELSQVSSLRDKGIDVKKDGASGLMHNKFMVVDPASSKPTLITGSANWTYSSSFRNDENLLVLKASKLASEYMSAFESYYSQGK
ncbi:MAG: hypothetical protein AUJ18_07280 [Candidatus Hydrogenedentes bacterium CG1_02_42_14]|nr:MAG: hypothetical protein AUJ18_07280 [Candidatus Hydrogenedentes bacterium CG1_02_42_14]